MRINKYTQQLNKLQIKILYLFVILSVAPISLYLETKQLNILNLLFGPDIFELRYVSVSLSHIPLFLATLFLLPSFFIRELTKLTLIDYTLLFIVFFMTLSLIAGIIVKTDEHLSYLSYFKSILFLFSYFIGRSVPVHMLPRILFLVIFSNFIFLASILLFGLLSGTYNVINPLKFVKILSGSIFEFRNLYPVIAYATLLLSFLFYSYYKGVERTVLGLNILFVIWLMLISWSRTALLIFVQTLIFSSLILFFLRPNVKKVINGLILFFVMIFFVGILFLIPEGYLPGISILERVSDGTGSGDDNRLEYMRLGLAKILENPLFGERYIPTFYMSPTGILYDNPRLFTPHNQYLDFGLRGGLLAMILILLFHLIFPFRIIYAAHKETVIFIQSFLVFLFSFIAALFLGNFGQNYFIQSASSFFIWFFIGMGVTLMNRNKSYV